MKTDRSTLYFNEPIEIDTPYQHARQQWDERIGSARVQAKNWRLMALCLLIFCLCLFVALLWQVQRGHVIPYVVEVADVGSVRSVGTADQNYTPNDKQIAFHISAFVSNIRSLSADPIVVRKNWLKAYAYVTDKAAARLSEHARKNDPFSQVGKRTISVDVTSVVRASPKSFQVRWIETSFLNGHQETKNSFTGLFTIRLHAPKTHEDLKANPLGIYIEAMNWSKDNTPGGDQ